MAFLKTRFIATGLLVSAVLFDAAAQTEPGDDGGYWDPMVVTSTGEPTRVSEAPSTVFVITGDEIRRSGATSIPEILQQVPGVEVRVMSASDRQVGIRGFAYQLAKQVLVLLDGRTVTVDFFGAAVYETLPINVVDIDRVEVVLGPGAAVYGSKAFLGVINIISRSASDWPGLEAHFTAGAASDLSTTQGRAVTRAGVRYAGAAGLFRYRVTAFGRRMPLFDDPKTQAMEARGATGRITFSPRPSQALALDAGIVHGPFTILPAGLSLHRFPSTLSHVRISGQTGLGGTGSPRGKLEFRYVWNGGRSRSSTFPAADRDFRGEWNTNILSASHDDRYELAGLPMSTRSGIELRHNTIDTNITSNEDDVLNIAAFASQEALLPANVRLTAGVRVDRQAFTSAFARARHVSVSPRFSLVYTPARNHHVRAAFNLGHNNASLSQLFNDYPLNPQVDNIGDPGLRPERITYQEVGYSGLPMKSLRVFSSVFAYRIDDPIILDFTRIPTQGELHNQNAGPMDAFGGEIGVDARPSPLLRLYASYSYIRLQAREGNPYQAENLGSPAHKVSGGARLILPTGFYASADASYFGPSEVDRPMGAGLAVFPLDEFLMLNARVGIRWANDLDLSVGGTNLLDDRTQQYPGAETPRRRLSFTLAYSP